MKKTIWGIITALLVFLVLTVSFAGYMVFCLTLPNPPTEWRFAEPIENVSKIEIIYRRGDEETVVRELEKDSDILSELEGMPCKTVDISPEIMQGQVLKVYYSDNSCEYITWDCNAYVKGEDWDFGRECFDEEEFCDILRRYSYEYGSCLYEEISDSDEHGVYKVSDEYTLSDSDAIDTGKYYALYYKNQEYTFRIFDSEGNIAKQGRCWRYPKISEVNDSTVLFTLQMGTGLSTQWGFFYDCENNIRSDKFYCIYDHADSIFAYGAPKKVIVRSIFSDDYYREFTEFENPLADCVEPILYAEFSDDAKTITITYLTGEDYREVSQDFSL